ncbi:YkvA family protein [Bacillus sp. Marseille-P3661]|uniref:YkvA family protein n=1 Tax=Bacillus sp. Marseille-P3661 TaxID=1936234 RepID=UPI000C860174|nr:YkvA family protein [Bacillus sp. Marseille-P3661]
MHNQEYEQGFKKYTTKASEYYEDKDKTGGLLKEAITKAGNKKEVLQDVWENLQLLFQLVRAWLNGDYKELPKRSIIMIIAAIIYFVSPADIVPDFLAGVGLLDDAAVLGFVLKQISNDLERFKLWKVSQKSIIENEKI